MFVHIHHSFLVHGNSWNILFGGGQFSLQGNTSGYMVDLFLLPGVVTQSQPTYDRLYERLKKAFQRGTPVRLTIRG